MDRIILLFEIANSQEDYSYLMQIIHLMECESEDIDIERLKCILPIKYLWDKTSGEYTNSQMVYRVERECFFKKGLFTEYQISNLNDLIKKRKDYDYYYYIRIKKHENHDIKNLQYFLLILQQFPAVCDKLSYFIDKFQDNIPGWEWENGSQAPINKLVNTYFIDAIKSEMTYRMMYIYTGLNILNLYKAYTSYHR